MVKHILSLITILGIIMGGMVAYANSSYFPMGEGVVLKEKMNNLESIINDKLDIILVEVKQ